MDDRGFRRSKNVEDRTVPTPPKMVNGFPVFMPDFVPTGPRHKTDPKLANSKLAKDLGADQLADAKGTEAEGPVFAGSQSDAVREAIRRAAEEDGVDPATALAYAERESSFNPSAKSSKTMRGLYQMSGGLRAEHGIGDTADPYEQTKGFNRYFGKMKADMAKRLGRDPTDTEAYAGHHFGPGRGARMFSMDPSTPVDQVFSPRERAENPHIVKAGTVGALLSDVTGDIDRRRSNHGAGTPVDLDFSQFDGIEPAAQGKAASLDFSQFGEL